MPDEETPLEAVGRLLDGGAGPKPAAIGAAVSGGGDSTALVLALVDWAHPLGIAVKAATVDHGLRDGAAAEARWVAELSAARGVGHRTLKLDGLADGPGLQARARDGRYAALAEWAEEEGLRIVLLGHTADDVAETLLMRLARGRGLDGLAQMPVRRRVGRVDFVRPLLGLSRAALRADLAARGVTPLEDPSNDEPRFERVRVRRAMAALDLDPLLLARSARHLADARAALDARIGAVGAAAFHEDRGDLLLLRRDMTSLRGVPREVLRRLLLAALRWIGGAPPPREAEQERFMSAVAGIADADRTPPLTLAGCLISPLAGPLRGLRIAREAGACAEAVPFVSDGGSGMADWDGRWRVRGPVTPDATVGALGDDVRRTPWRKTGLPRASLMASPALRRGDRLLAAPLAGMANGVSAWTAPPFAATLRPD